MITIHSMRGNNWPNKPWQVRVDRASVLGNPFGLSKIVLRDESCDAYQTYFHDKVNSSVVDALFMDELMRLKWLHDKYGQLELYCWCAPQRCHSETIKTYLDAQIKTEEPA